MVNFEHNKVIFCVAILDDNFGLRTILDAQALQRYHFVFVVTVNKVLKFGLKDNQNEGHC